MKSVTALSTTVFLCSIGGLVLSVMVVLNVSEAVGTLVLQSFQQVPISLFHGCHFLCTLILNKQAKNHPNLEHLND